MRIHRNRKLLVITYLLAIAIYPINLRAGYVPEAIQGYYRQAIANKAIEISNQNTDYDKYNRLGPTSFDCSGFAYYVYKKCGYSISSVCAASQAKEMEEDGLLVTSKKAGDLIFYDYTKAPNGRYLDIDHVSIYVGYGMMVDASSSRDCIVYRSFTIMQKDIVMMAKPADFL